MDDFKTIPLSEKGAKVLFKAISVALYEGLDRNSDELNQVIRVLKAAYPEIAQEYNF